MGLIHGLTLSRRRFVGSGMALALGPALPAAAAPAEGEDARLMALLQDITARADALDPLGMVDRGGGPNVEAFRRSYTAAEVQAWRMLNRWALQRLGRINRAQLSAERRISLDSMLADTREEAERLRPDYVALSAVRPFNHFGGFHVEFASIVSKGGRAELCRRGRLPPQSRLYRRIPASD